QGAQRLVAGVADLMPLPGLDQQQRALLQRVALAVDDGLPRPGDDVQPLVGAPVAIVRPALGFPGGQRHLCGLRAAVAQDDAETLPEPQALLLHGITPLSTNHSRPGYSCRTWRAARITPVKPCSDTVSRGGRWCRRPGRGCPGRR